MLLPGEVGAQRSLQLSFTVVPLAEDLSDTHALKGGFLTCTEGNVLDEYHATAPAN